VSQQALDLTSNRCLSVRAGGTSLLVGNLINRCVIFEQDDSIWCYIVVLELSDLGGFCTW
jgi:hypothetical protein